MKRTVFYQVIFPTTTFPNFAALGHLGLEQPAGYLIIGARVVCNVATQHGSGALAAESE